jgi:hydrogenase expression/formation protein HypD
MKYVDEFRDPELAAGLLQRIREVATGMIRPARVMEICGGHTVAACRNGLHTILPDMLTLVSGPGCPVCVTPSSVIDAAIWLAREAGAHVCTFGDMLRVPGTETTLGECGAGDALQIIYSPLQVVEYAAAHPDAQCVLIGVGFETTAPTLAAAIVRAAERELTNFSFLPATKLTPPAMRALLNDAEVALDAFIAPGHVTTVIGADAYNFIADEYGRPCVVAGFEVCDVLAALAMIIVQLCKGDAAVEIQYRRSVTCAGNRKAQQLLARVFSVRDDTWRGLGVLPQSGYELSDEFAGFDVRTRFDLPVFEDVEAPGCRCGEVLRGVCRPPDCPLFGKACTPEHAVGPCMVSSEGSCGAYYRYGVASGTTS